MKPEDQHPRLSAGLYMNIHIHAPACSCMHNTCTFFLYLVPLFLPPKLWYYPRMTLAPRVHLSRHQIGILIQLDLLASSSPLFSWWTLMFQRGVVWTEHLHPPPQTYVEACPWELTANEDRASVNGLQPWLELTRTSEDTREGWTKKQAFTRHQIYWCALILDFPIPELWETDLVFVVCEPESIQKCVHSSFGD